MSNADLVAAALAAIPPKTTASAPRPAPAPAPPPAPAPAPRLPLVAATGPNEAELLEEAEWEATNARLFGLPADGPATRALAARGVPTLAEQRRSARFAAEQAQVETFQRNAEAARLADVARIDAARNARIVASTASREAAQRAQERAHWPELP